MSSIHRSLEKARRPARIKSVTKSEPEKTKLVLGFELGLLGQNATALPLGPPPRPQMVAFSLYRGLYLAANCLDIRSWEAQSQDHVMTNSHFRDLDPIL